MRIRGLTALVIWLVLLAVPAGQTGTLRWDLADISAANATALEHRVYVGPATTPVVLTGVTCAATSATGVTCAAVLPSTIARGASIQMTTYRASDQQESAKSAAFVIPLPPPAAPPPTPTNLRFSGTAPLPQPPPGGLPLFRPAI